ncbi:MAG: sel1 repeat family protein [Deltaproteobacteria bacterium]|nr:sel1 repeat family protein [Deltaproteobacteria bacterium]
MSFAIIIGSVQNYPWLKHERSVQRVRNSARACIKKDRFNQLHRILKPLIKKGNPEALYLAAGFSRPMETFEEYERRYVDYIQRAAAKEYPPALYVLGFYYDMGDAAPVIPQDKIKAAQMFKRGAELKHAHCQHPHAEALLWGAPGINIDIPTGLAFLRDSADAKFKGSLQLLAEFYEKGDFGLPVDSAKAAELRTAAEKDDVIDY